MNSEMATNYLVAEAHKFVSDHPGWVLLHHIFRHLAMEHCGSLATDPAVGLAIATVVKLKLEMPL